MSKHIMVDIETWGTGSDALPISIGACRFNPVGGEIEDRFYVCIDPASAKEAGLSISADTLLWWMAKERNDARDAWLAQSRVDIWTALQGFSEWMTSDEFNLVWGNGATFDNVILRSAFEKATVTCPWKFWQDACYRTLKGLAPAIKIERSGTHHDALDDAVDQAKHMQAVVAHLGLQL